MGRRFIAGSFGKVQTEDSTVLKDDDDDDDDDEEYEDEEEEVVNDDVDDDNWVVSDTETDSILFEYPEVSDGTLFLSFFLGENLETENSILKKKKMML